MMGLVTNYVKLSIILSLNYVKWLSIQNINFRSEKKSLDLRSYIDRFKSSYICFVNILVTFL